MPKEKIVKSTLHHHLVPVMTLCRRRIIRPIKTTPMAAILQCVDQTQWTFLRREWASNAPSRSWSSRNRNHQICQTIMPTLQWQCRYSVQQWVRHQISWPTQCLLLWMFRHQATDGTVAQVILLFLELISNIVETIPTTLMTVLPATTTTPILQPNPSTSPTMYGSGIIFLGNNASPSDHVVIFN